MVVAVLVVACDHEPDSTPAGLPPDDYALGYCEKACTRSIECNYTDDRAGCLDSCVDRIVRELDSDRPCVEEQFEWNRCRHDLYTCEELLDVYFQGTAERDCSEWRRRHSWCVYDN